MSEGSPRFDQIHIDVARNATDDFNPFHDPKRWRNIRPNPFGGTIALGFQMEFLAADRIARLRQHDNTSDDPRVPGHRFGNYEFDFANALHAGEPFDIAVRKTTVGRGQGDGPSNRVVLRKISGELVLLGSQRETAVPRHLGEWTEASLPSPDGCADRSEVGDSGFFLKRKFLNTSNGKNFVVGCLCDQADYFDELSEQVRFPPLFTAALVSSALLEKGRHAGYDFEADPLLYVNHRISVDNRIQAQLQSNDCLEMLIDEPVRISDSAGLGGVALEQQQYRCFGVVRNRGLLFRALVRLVPLHALLERAIR
jgi:hypothetical protein